MQFWLFAKIYVVSATSILGLINNLKINISLIMAYIP